MERIVTIYPVFLELIEQIGVKIGYGKVMILSTCRLVQKMENWGEDWIWHVRIFYLLDKLSEFNEKWKIAVNIGYVKLGYNVYAGYEPFDCFDFRRRSKHGNRDEQIYRICKLDRRNWALYSRKRMPHLSTLLWSPWSKIPRLYSTCDEKISVSTSPSLPASSNQNLQFLPLSSLHGITPSWNIYPFLLP